MGDTGLDESEHNSRSSEYADPNQTEFSYPGNGCGSGSAKYKLLSPSKLPITRSPCITIPPGFSPTSFLESPVLLSNMKAEPSPTTGTLMKPQMSQGSISCTPYPPTTNYSAISISNDVNSSSFEFRPYSSMNMVNADINHWKSEHSIQVQEGSGQSQFAPAPLVKSEMAVTSNESYLSAPVAASGTSTPTEGDSDELNQRGNSISGVQTVQFDHKGSGASVISSDDGYNWRKYGQKHVKGSEFPRSYYKCTHPNCEVKKLFERSHDGQITEIIYKGTHDHPKPQPSRRYNTGAMMSIQEEKSDKFLSLTGRDDKSPSIYGQISNTNEPNGTPELSPITANDDSLEGTGPLPNRTNDEVDDDDPYSKRRRMDVGGIDIAPVVKSIREPRVVVQTLSEVDILDDGYRWRKYGQKVVRGNPNPRSYYKCTNAGCPVRKHVERASHDPKAVITTYEGKHNHNVPTARTSSHDTAGPVSASVPSKFRSNETDCISLDLGVGISSAVDNRSNEYQSVERQTQNSNLNVIHANPIPTYYGVWNSSLNQYGSRENLSEGHNIESPSLRHSAYPYPQNMGRVLTGP